MRTSIQVIVAILLIVIGVSLLGYMMVGGETTNQYTVKLEQVEDGRHIDFDEVVPIEEMSESEQGVLYEAFKEIDHFFGSEEVRFETDDTASFETPFTLVEHAGVSMLVAVDGPKPVKKMTGSVLLAMFFGILATISGFGVGMDAYEEW